MDTQPPESRPPKDTRRMTIAKLDGQHMHEAAGGVRVNIFQRSGAFIARGRIQGQAFGKSLGKDAKEASRQLRRLLTVIEDGRFVRPTEARQSCLPTGPVPHLSLRELINDFLTEKRQLRGESTMTDYRARLMPVLDFAERSATSARYSLAMRIDREFAINLKAYLIGEHVTTRNGRPGAKPKPPSGRQVFNILECLRNCLNWACSPVIRKLPPDWANPLTREIVGERPRKDPLRVAKLPIDERVVMVKAMDRWQLCQLSPSFVLPMRPEEAAGLVISEARWIDGVLTFGTRMGGGDFTKGKQDFQVPFPPELRPILAHCVGGRAAGPLLRDRRAFEGLMKRTLSSDAELRALYEAELAKSPPRTVITEQDRKGVFRRVLQTRGGVSPNQLAREFQAVRKAAGLTDHVRFYDLRHTVTTDMYRAGVPHLDLTYMTGHSTRDILSEYVGLAPIPAMEKYFASIRPLLTAIVNRARELGITDANIRVAS